MGYPHFPRTCYVRPGEKIAHNPDFFPNGAKEPRPSYDWGIVFGPCEWRNTPQRLKRQYTITFYSVIKNRLRIREKLGLVWDNFGRTFRQLLENFGKTLWIFMKGQLSDDFETSWRQIGDNFGISWGLLSHYQRRAPLPCGRHRAIFHSISLFGKISRMKGDILSSFPSYCVLNTKLRITTTMAGWSNYLPHWL